MKRILKLIIDKMPADKASRLKLILTVILSAAFIFAWANTIKVIQKRFGGGKAQKVYSPTLAVNSVPKIEKSPLAQRIYDHEDGLEWIRCPFSGKFYIDGGDGIVTLSGILWDDKTPKAVINSQIVGIGDDIDEYSVVDISRSSITLNNGVKDIEILLEE